MTAGIRDRILARNNPPYIQRPRHSAIYGERNGHARLTEDIVREARRRRALGESGRALAREYGVAAMTMSDALRGVNWSHVK